MSLPNKEAIIAFIQQTNTSVGKREIAREFGLKGEERDELKLLLREMIEEGLLAGSSTRSLHVAGGMPRVAVLLVVAAEGARVTAVPDQWEGEGNPPRIAIQTGGARMGRGPKSASRREKYEVGDRILTRISGDSPKFQGHVIKRLARGHAPLMGVVRKDEYGTLVLKSLDKRERKTYPIHHSSEVKPGEMIRGELKGSGARAAVHVLQRMGKPFEGEKLSNIAIAAKNIPYAFPSGLEEEAERIGSEDIGEREDLRDIPFLTIDPADARDHDDAVWAEPDGDGWRLLVAIADVSWFVRPGSALDRNAFDRGNSVYFPDQVVPMLPEALSNGACSLKAGTDKAALIADMRIGNDGSLQSWVFRRARIRIAENMAYETAQAVMDGREESYLKESVLEPLWGCWGALSKAREARAPLDLDLPEKRVVLDSEGNVAGIVLRERFDAHRLIEDMMIIANVAAAKALEAKVAPVMYRCHEAPDREKLTSLKSYLGTLGVKLALGQVITPATFNRVLSTTKERTDYTEIAEAVLRSQTPAYYSPRGTGHFGLGLASYAHFTSPIRRYADVCVHRALVRTYNLGEGGLPQGAEQRFLAIGEHISFTERRAMEAERETLDRYIARHLANHVGEVVRARISGVQSFGFFATVDGIGGDGIVPVSALGEERFRFDEEGRFLEGNSTGTRYGVGQMLDLRLEEADPVTGSLRFSLPGVEGFEGHRRQIRRDGRGAPMQGMKRRGGPPPGIRRGRR